MRTSYMAATPCCLLYNLVLHKGRSQLILKCIFKRAFPCTWTPLQHLPQLYVRPPHVQHASAWVLRDSRAIYRAASEGVINLADKFFEMERTDALKWVVPACGGLGVLGHCKPDWSVLMCGAVFALPTSFYLLVGGSAP